MSQSTCIIALMTAAAMAGATSERAPQTMPEHTRPSAQTRHAAIPNTSGSESQRVPPAVLHYLRTAELDLDTVLATSGHRWAIGVHGKPRTARKILAFDVSGKNAQMLGKPYVLEANQEYPSVKWFSYAREIPDGLILAFNDVAEGWSGARVFRVLDHDLRLTYEEPGTPCQPARIRTIRGRLLMLQKTAYLQPDGCVVGCVAAISDSLGIEAAWTTALEWKDEQWRPALGTLPEVYSSAAADYRRVAALLRSGHVRECTSKAAMWATIVDEWVSRADALAKT